MITKNTKIAVLLGGLSGEKEVSRESGGNIVKALQARGYAALALEVDRNLPQALKDSGAEAVFNGLHGTYGEDGCVQGLLELMAIPYTGSGVKASALAMDKTLTKRIAASLGIRTPAFLELKKQDALSEAVFAASGLVFPLIVKPSSEGSSLGLAKVSNFAELAQAVEAARTWPGAVLLEEFIQGRELTVGWVDGRILPVLEIIPESGFYDYHAKYVSNNTRYECPAALPEKLAKQVQDQSLSLMEALGVEGAARADFLLNPAGEAYFLEINTLPGMTSHSLVPKASKVLGLSFEDLIEKILLSARLKIS